MKKNIRINFWQYVKGISIILVVLIHSRSGRLYLADAEYYNFYYWLTLRAFINFPVSVFIFLSGYFTSTQKLENQPLNYVSRRISQLGIPYLVWSSIYHFNKHGFNIGGISVRERITDILLGTSSSQLYFVLVLIQLTVLAPLILKAVHNKKLNLLMWSVTPIYFLFLYRHIILNGTQFDFYETWFPAWFIYYYAGLSVRSRNRAVLLSSTKKHALILLAGAIFLSLVETYSIYFSGVSLSLASSQIKFSGILLSFAVLNFLFVMSSIEIKESRVLSFLRYLGDHSFGIYFIHMLWRPATVDIMLSISGIEEALLPYHIVQVGLMLGLTIATKELLKLILRKRIVSKYLGL